MSTRRPSCGIALRRWRVPPSYDEPGPTIEFRAAAPVVVSGSASPLGGGSLRLSAVCCYLFPTRSMAAALVWQPCVAAGSFGMPVTALPASRTSAGRLGTLFQFGDQRREHSAAQAAQRVELAFRAASSLPPSGSTSRTVRRTGSSPRAASGARPRGRQELGRRLVDQRLRILQLGQRPEAAFEILELPLAGGEAPVGVGPLGREGGELLEVGQRRLEVPGVEERPGDRLLERQPPGPELAFGLEPVEAGADLVRLALPGRREEGQRELFVGDERVARERSIEPQTARRTESRPRPDRRGGASPRSRPRRPSGRTPWRPPAGASPPDPCAASRRAAAGPTSPSACRATRSSPAGCRAAGPRP